MFYIFNFFTLLKPGFNHKEHRVKGGRELKEQIVIGCDGAYMMMMLGSYKDFKCGAKLAGVGEK